MGRGWAFTSSLNEMGPSDPFQMCVPGRGEMYRDVGDEEGGNPQPLVQHHICKKPPTLSLIKLSYNTFSETYLNFDSDT